MRKKQVILAFLGVSIILSSANAQDDQNDKEQLWKSRASFGLNMTQSSFTNWASGGRNNLSGLAFINAQADYKKEKLSFASILALGLGGIQYFDEGLQKTDDVIDLQANLSYTISDSKLNYSVLAGFRTQFLEGFTSPADTVRSSTFMAPGYGNVSLGIEYKPDDHFRIMVSPLSGKFTFVMDQTLADAGAFGVREAELAADGSVLTDGANFRPELGSYIRVMYSNEIAKNIDLRTRWEFFSNYLNNPENIDVNGELLMNFKVNEWFSASLQANLIYDDDIQITDRFGNTGPRTQFKQVIGLGLAYRIANFKEKKD